LRQPLIHVRIDARGSILPIFVTYQLVKRELKQRAIWPVNAPRYHERAMKTANAQQTANNPVANKHFECGNSGAGTGSAHA
jgi:hypothetical protein